MTRLQQWLIEQVFLGMDRDELTQTLLAHRAGLSQKHVSQLLTGQSMGTLDAWERLLLAAGMLDDALA